MTKINGFEIENYNVYGIKDRATTSTCPVCSEHRKKKNDKCMSVFWDTGLGQCNHCGERVQLHTYKKKENTKVYIRPKPKQKSNLSDIVLKWFKNERAISEKTLIDLKISECRKWMPKAQKEIHVIEFNYFLFDELVNIKSRGKDKDFMFEKDCELIMYNLDAIIGQKECVLVEGEIDCLSFHEAGVKNVSSVPNGFTLPKKDGASSINLNYIDDYIGLFDSVDKIYLAFDNDTAGQEGTKEFIRRLGAEKCCLVDFKDCKDANEYLKKYGSFELSLLIKDAKEVKIEGIFTLQDNFKSMMNGFENGQKRGESTYIDDVDKAWKWRTSEVNVWTGYQNEGKSLFLNQLSVIKAFFDGDKFAIFSPENMPMDDFYNDLIEMYIGKTTDPYYKESQMTKGEYLEAMGFVDKHFFMVYPDFDFKLDTILNKVKSLVRKKGIKHFILDPYNTIEHLMNSGEREDLYISRFMATLKRFSIDNDISIHLVAHQITQRPNKDDGGRLPKPMLNNIKGGGTFADKADNVLFIWRPNRLLDFRDNEVIFGSQKIKKQKLVARPCDVSGITFEYKENRYYFNGVCGFSKIDKKRNNLIEQEKEFIKEVAPFPMIGLDEVKTVFDDINFDKDEDNEIPF